jgi:hypothetical protein
VSVDVKSLTAPGRLNLFAHGQTDGHDVLKTIIGNWFGNKKFHINGGELLPELAKAELIEVNTIAVLRHTQTGFA